MEDRLSEIKNQYQIYLPYRAFFTILGLAVLAFFVALGLAFLFGATPGTMLFCMLVFCLISVVGVYYLNKNRFFSVEGTIQMTVEYFEVTIGGRQRRINWGEMDNYYVGINYRNPLQTQTFNLFIKPVNSSRLRLSIIQKDIPRAGIIIPEDSVIADFCGFVKRYNSAAATPFEHIRLRRGPGATGVFLPVIIILTVCAIIMGVYLVYRAAHPHKKWRTDFSDTVLPFLVALAAIGRMAGDKKTYNRLLELQGGE